MKTLQGPLVAWWVLLAAHVSGASDLDLQVWGQSTEAEVTSQAQKGTLVSRPHTLRERRTGHLPRHRAHPPGDRMNEREESHLQRRLRVSGARW